MSAESRLYAEMKTLRAKLERVEVSNRELAKLFLTYMDEVGLDRPERVKRAKLLADMGITIIGGRATREGQFAECTAVGRLDIAGFFASGVLAMSPHLVVTAARCSPPVSTLPTRVALGIEDTTDLGAGQVLPGDFNGYPGYVVGGPHDIAVMVLAEGAKKSIPPVDLATTAELEAAREVTLVGFGDVDAAGTTGAGVKRWVTVPIQFLRGGASDKPGNPMAKLDFDKDLEFAAGVNGAGACVGDSGGPAYIDTGDGRKLAGIVSRSSDTGGPVCGGLAILTRVDLHREWILKQIPPA